MLATFLPRVTLSSRQGTKRLAHTRSHADGHLTPLIGQTLVTESQDGGGLWVSGRGAD